MSGNQVKIAVRVQPNATRNELVSFADGVLRLKIAAPPIKGKANKELLFFLSQLLGIGKGSLTIVKGPTNKNKVIAIDGLNWDEVVKRLPLRPSSSADARTI